jgi:hypothetical protein
MARLVLIASLLAGCYQPSLVDCATTCGTSNSCPDGTTCRSGMCRLDDSTGSCPAMPGVDAPMPDGPEEETPDGPAATCPPAPVGQGCTLLPGTQVAPGCHVVCSAKTWTEARGLSAGTWHLAIVSTAPEADLIKTAIAAAGVPSAWIGLDQPLGQATPLAGWKWTDGSALGSFAPWANMQPNDGNGTEDGGEQCAMMTAGGTWSDDVCALGQAFVLEPF